MRGPRQNGVSQGRAPPDFRELCTTITVLYAVRAESTTITFRSSPLGVRYLTKYFYFKIAQHRMKLIRTFKKHIKSSKPWP